MKNLQNLSLKGIRILSGKTIAEVAEQVNLSPKTYRTYERTPKKFTIEQAFKLCLLYGINIDEFMQLRSESNDDPSYPYIPE